MAAKGKAPRIKARRSIAELEVELLKRTAERDEALAQQTATAEVLQVINSSPGDLAPVFDAMLEKALRLCDAAFGLMRTYDGERFRPVAMRGLPPTYAGYLATTSDQPGPDSPSQRVIRGETLIKIVDLAEEERYRSGDPYARALVDLGGARSAIVVALRKDEALLGTIMIYRQEVRPFADTEIALLQNFAAQAVIAMENARLITETREALEQQTATAEVLQVINSSPGDLAPVFDAILEKAHALCGATMGGLAIFDGEQFRFVAAHDLPDFVEHTVRPSPDGNAPLDQLTRGEPLIHLADARAADAYREVPRFRSLMDTRGVRTFLVVPLRKDGALLGAIGAYRQEVRPFSDKQIALLQNFAAQAVIAMENARLLDELRQRTDEVAELNRGLEARVAEQVEELGRVGRLKRFLAPQLAELIAICLSENAPASNRAVTIIPNSSSPLRSGTDSSAFTPDSLESCPNGWSSCAMSRI
jgi:GAF domain-containing protein